MAHNGAGTFSIAICDDDKRYVKKLHDMLLEEEKEIGDFRMSFFYTGDDLLGVDVTKYNLLILDMVFPKRTGRDIAREYRKRNKDGMIVFCTGESSPIPEDFRLQPYRFMRKDKILEMKKDFSETIDEMYRREAKEKIVLTSGKKHVVLNIEDIVYAEIIKTGSRVYYHDKNDNTLTVCVKEKLREIYPKVAPFGFEFAHNSYLVNCHKVISWTLDDVVMCVGKKLSVSRAKSKKFNAACIKWIA